MRMSRLVVAVVLVLAGLVWMGQGSGIIGGSAMSGSSFWAVVGVILVVAGLAVGALEWRHSTRRTG